MFLPGLVLRGYRQRSLKFRRLLDRLKRPHAHVDVLCPEGPSSSGLGRGKVDVSDPAIPRTRSLSTDYPARCHRAGAASECVRQPTRGASNYQQVFPLMS